MTPPEPAEQLREALRAHGHHDGSAVVVGRPEPGSPPPPEGPWVLVPRDGWMVGGLSRGAFRPYGAVADLDAAIDLVLELLGPPRHATVRASAELLARGQATGPAIHARTLARDGRQGPCELQPGDVVDLLGWPSGHHVFALGTPFPLRSQPPSLAGAPYHRYAVRAPLSLAREGLVSPWFEQPGGGPMVSLGYPVRWHLDAGELTEIVD